MSEYESEPVVEQPLEEPAETTWAPSQEEWGQLTQAVNYLAQLEQQRAQVYQPPQQDYQDWDPYDREQVRALFREEFQPYAQDREQARLGEAEELARDILTDLAKRDGEFDIDLARLRAEQHLPEMQQRYGFSQKAAEEALARAAEEQRQWELQRDGQAVNRYTNQIATLAGAPGEAGSTYTQGVQQRTMPDYRQGGTVTQRFFGGNGDGS